MDRGRAWALILIPAATLGAALLGSLATVDASAAYERLEQPRWAPPSWLFGPVWTTLYVMIAASGVLLWRQGGWSIEMRLWTVQLVLNALWSPLFFSLQERGAALAWIAGLDVAVALLVVRAWRLRWPAWLLVPYMAWILFATALNASVWWLNRR